MKPGRIRLLLLAVDIGAIAVITGLFAWSLRGIHRFPTEAAIFVSVYIALLLSNAVYIWRQPKRPSD
jgi:hypothetical protein